MEAPVKAALAFLPDRHRRALEWFDSHAGQVVPWPQPLADGTLLVIKPKGIYKPEWSDCALSIRQSLSGPYPDRDVEHDADGSWRYMYFQEGFDPSSRESYFTNQGLIRCWQSTVPVGVLIQTKPKPNSQYRVLGLALVNGVTDEGYFVLQGLSAGVAPRVMSPITSPAAMPSARRADLFAGAFDPTLVDDERERSARVIAQRRGQPGFRRLLLDAYEHRCAITGYDAEEALEAAHIVPYRGPVTNHPTNGLLLRADLHTLFDLRKLSIHEETLEIRLASELLDTKYRPLQGTRLFEPRDDELKPSALALAQHRTWSGL